MSIYMHLPIFMEVYTCKSIFRQIHMHAAPMIALTCCVSQHGVSDN